MSGYKANILVVDDEPDIRQLVQEILQDEGYSVNMAGNAEEAAELEQAFRELLKVCRLSKNELNNTWTAAQELSLPLRFAWYLEVKIVLGDDLTVPIIAPFGDSLQRIIIDSYQAKSRRITFRPLKII